MPKKKSKAKTGRYSKAFTADQFTSIVGAYKKGKTLDELAAQYKCSTSKIRKALLTKKVKMRPRGPKGDPSKPKPKAKKISKPKAKKVSKPKAKAKVKKSSKPKAVNIKISAPKVKVTVVKPAAKKAKPKNSGLAKTLAAVAAANPAPAPTAHA